MNLQKKAEQWLLEQDKELGQYIIKQARMQAMGDRQLYEDLVQEGVLCMLEAKEGQLATLTII